MFKDIAEFIKYRIEKANEALVLAGIFFETHRWHACVSSLYDAAYYCVNALLIINGIQVKTHKGSKSKFLLLYINTNIINQQFGKLYSDLYSFRQKIDRKEHFEIDKDTAFLLLHITEEFITEIEKHLNNSSVEETLL